MSKLVLSGDTSGSVTSSIVTEKQRLRDVTNLVDTATTLDELKGLSA